MQWPACAGVCRTAGRWRCVPSSSFGADFFNYFYFFELFIKIIKNATSAALLYFILFITSQEIRKYHLLCIHSGSSFPGHIVFILWRYLAFSRFDLIINRSAEHVEEVHCS